MSARSVTRDRFGPQGPGRSSIWGDMGWDTAISRWTDYMKAAGVPKTTQGLRLHHVKRVAKGVGAKPATLRFEDLARWLGEQDWMPNTRRTYRASLRSFYAWAMAVGLAESSPAHLLAPVSVPRARPRPTPEAAYRAAMRSADARVRLAIMLAGVCGLRRGEVARARRDDVEADLMGHCLRVNGKGGHVRLVPLPDPVARVILARGPGWLFPSPHGGHLTPHHLGKLVSAELRDGWTMHTLRHRCGTLAYQSTKDLRATQELLGHAKPETTAIYTEVPDQALRAAVSACL